ncbi:MAG: response regulator, partial [Beijerinckiaceae bacterium]|nr:response regulator [Beijerinckiaceae bacterium]
MNSPSPVVLLVEGDILVRHPLAEYLPECGFTVFEASNGDVARRALTISTLQLEVVLADMTSEGSGFALQRWIKEQNHPADVIMAGSIEKAVDCAAGICHEGPALSKPYEHRLVLDHIRRALARR